jgi:hypothetical protein
MPQFNVGTPAAIRTRDPLLRRQMLYPPELRAHTDVPRDLRLGVDERTRFAAALRGWPSKPWPAPISQRNPRRRAAPGANLLRFVPSGEDYVRIRLKGKLIERSITTCLDDRGTRRPPTNRCRPSGQGATTGHAGRRGDANGGRGFIRSDQEGKAEGGTHFVSGDGELCWGGLMFFREARLAATIHPRISKETHSGPSHVMIHADLPFVFMMFLATKDGPSGKTFDRSGKLVGTRDQRAPCGEERPLSRFLWR